MRIGHGYDVHRLTLDGENSGVVLGGVTIDCEYSLIAHSDGDVVLHAICDALLGAAALGDIGRYFPDTDEAYAGADSRQLMRDVLALVHKRQWQVANLDVTVVAQVPKLAPFIEQMCETIAQDLEVDVRQVNVKATTTEGLGFVGEKQGIAAFAVVLLEGLKPSY